ncbi:MAG: phosphomannomutase [Candidatus Latescibacteria bacterium]|nr:phosphomannomutase [Candidatus Latescibacterota bacterium]
MNTQRLGCFKAYDIRGKIPDDFNEEMAYILGRAYVAEVKPGGAIAVGRDIRDSSVSLSKAMIRGINDAGIDTVDIGLSGTEMVYFASSLEGMGGGAMITASHNPKGYNGIKLVKKNARPISGDTGLLDMEYRVRTGDVPPKASHAGTNKELDVMSDYVKRILSFINPDILKPLIILANPGNGCAGPVIDVMESMLPFKIKRLNFDPDGTFPNGIPNPLLIENRSMTSNAVIASGADMGVAWDGDFDRCFLFDEKGQYIEGYYLVGFLAKRILGRMPGEKIVIDPRLTWNSFDIVKKAGGETVVSKSGHSFIKEKMRSTNAVYGGEMSAHHYFRDFSFSDSGMIPWLLVAEELSITGHKLSELVEKRIKMYPCSGEINRTVDDPDKVLTKVKEHFTGEASAVTELDGISMEFGTTWRFNLRKSNTEPLVRLNVEAYRDIELMKDRTRYILELMSGNDENN